jgi:cyclophilin family peptidyl-prolyl cis-trans isomerase
MALGENLDNLPFLLDSMVMRSMDNLVTQTALADAMASMMSNLNEQQFGKTRRKKYLDSIQTGFVRLWSAELETGALTVLAKAMKQNDFKSEEWLQLLEDKKNGLELPRQYEAWLELEKTLAYLKGESFSVPQNKLRRASMNFKVYEGRPRVLVRTTNGTFILELMPEKAPFTVQNFEKLVAEDYFSGKSFHRVASNFVVQTGCNHGDSYGALDYTITSELDDAYYENAGLVGMASAGKHTESAQWFITLTPTPKLNGRYTIFARVVSGMQIVQKLQIGDRINSIEIIE